MTRRLPRPTLFPYTTLFRSLRRPRLYGFHTGTRSLANRKGRGRRRGGREREPRRAGEASPKPPPKPPPKPRSGLCPELLADFRIPKPPGCSQGRRGQFSVQSDNRFSGRGGGVGSLPRAWRRVGVPGAAGAKKIVRLASVFPSPPFGLPTSQGLGGLGSMDSTLALGAFRIARGAGGEAVDVNGNLVEREVPPGGAEGSFLCSLSSRFSGRGGGVGSLPRAWRRVGVPRRCVGAKKIVRLASTSFAALWVFRLRRAEAASAVWIPHWHSEPFESEGTRAAKRYVNGNLVEREKGDEFGIKLLLPDRLWPVGSKK